MSRQVNFPDHDISVLIEETVEDLALTSNTVNKPGRKIRDIIKVCNVICHVVTACDDLLSAGYPGSDALPRDAAGAGADSSHHLSLRLFLRDEVKLVLSKTLLTQFTFEFFQEFLILTYVINLHPYCLD